MVDYLLRSKPLVFAAAAAGLMLAGAAQAQIVSTTGANANNGYRASVPQQLQTDAARDSNGAPVSSDGVTQAGEDQSGFARDGADGAFDTLSGVGSSGALAGIDGDLKVVTRAAPSQAAGAASTNANTDNRKDTTRGDANHVQ